MSQTETNEKECCEFKSILFMHLARAVGHVQKAGEMLMSKKDENRKLFGIEGDLVQMSFSALDEIEAEFGREIAEEVVGLVISDDYLKPLFDFDARDRTGNTCEALAEAFGIEP